MMNLTRGRVGIGKDFTINAEAVDTNYKTMESPYEEVERKPESMKFKFGEHKLFLDIENGVRKFD